MLRLPTVAGLMQRRILVNYRIDSEIAAKLIPPPFRPQIVDGYAIGGICLIRLTRLRPWFLPAACGFCSENAAHRFAVEWTEGNQLRRGVYVPRRDSSSWFNALVGGRLFPGLHHRARFEVQESETRWHVQFASVDGSAAVSVDAERAETVPAGSVFRDLAEATAFFRAGAAGFSPSVCPDCFDGLELHADRWSLEPLAVRQVASSLFDNREQFPAGAAEFDSAFLMQDVPHRWVTLPTMACRPSVLLDAAAASV